MDRECGPGLIVAAHDSIPGTKHATLHPRPLHATHSREQDPPRAWLTGGQVSAALQGMDDATGPLNDPTFGLLYFEPKG